MAPKQRITGSRILRQLREEHYEVTVSTVREYLRERWRQFTEVHILLVSRPGDEGQFDFLDVTVEDKGQSRWVWKLLMRLPYSERDYVGFCRATS